MACEKKKLTIKKLDQSTAGEAEACRGAAKSSDADPCSLPQAAAPRNLQDTDRRTAELYGQMCVLAQLCN